MTSRTLHARCVVLGPTPRRCTFVTRCTSSVPTAPPSASRLSTAALSGLGPVAKLERSINSVIIGSALLVIDKLYEGRDFPRFYALETVARVPYFAFMSVLHLYETVGWWRRVDYLKLHFAQTMNEYHHLLIMESLGGDKEFKDRFVAQHMAVFYYWIACAQYLVSPRMAYNLSEQVEEHAYHTYDEFLTKNEAELKTKPAPEVAVQYYTKGDLYLFDEFQTSRMPQSRRPVCAHLHDVFTNIRDDEGEHMRTMAFCQQPDALARLRSPSTLAAMRGSSDAAACLSPTGETSDVCEADTDTFTSSTDAYADDIRTCQGIVECVVENVSGGGGSSDGKNVTSRDEAVAR